MRWLIRFRVTAIVCALAVCSANAAAEVPLSKYAELRKNVPQFKDYLVGVGRGIFWANVLLDVHGKQKLFCMPEKLAFDEGIILSLLEPEIRSPSSGKPWPADDAVEMIMAFAIASRFPCKP